MKIYASMRAALVLGAAVFGVTSLVHVSPVVAQEKKAAVSKELAKTLKAAEDSVKAKKYADALVKLKDAEGNPKKSPYDQHVINELSSFAYAKLGNAAEAARTNEALINDSFTPPSEVQTRVKAAMASAYTAKNYDKAIEYGNKAVKGGYADEETKALIAQSYYLKGDYKDAQKLLQPTIDSEIKAGKTPKDSELQLLMSSCMKVDDNECTTKSLERLVTYYPKPDYWKNLLYTLRNDHALTQSDRNSLQLFRLMSEVDVLNRPEDYTEMAQIAMDQGSPGEAQHILEKAFQKGVFADQRSKDKNQRLLDAAKKAATTDQSQLPKMEADANSAPTGDKAVGVGLAYLGYGRYDKAVELIQKGLSKGGLKSEAEARLLLGIAQLKAGHKDEAAKAFRSVKGDPALERLANLWNLHAKQA